MNATQRKTDPYGRVNATGMWREVQATTLEAAKRAASRLQKFQHTIMHVGVI